MKLTNQMRDAYVRAVMADVPKISTSGVESAITAWVQTEAPPEIAAVWVRKDLRKWLETSRLWFGGLYYQIDDPEKLAAPRWLGGEYPQGLQAELDKLKVEGEKREELQTKLRTTVYGCTTHKQLRGALPEFAKYLPEPVAKVKYAVATTGVVEAFKEMGWPKEATA